jgi:hypothetical protein
MIAIYALVDPRNNKVRYIGQSVNCYRRIVDHIGDKSAKTPVAKWVAELRSLSLRPSMLILEEVSANELTACERKWILKHKSKGTELLNRIIPIINKHSQKMSLSVQQVLNLAAESMVDPRTVAKIYAGGVVRGQLVRSRVVDAALKLKYGAPPAVAKKKKKK